MIDLTNHINALRLGSNAPFFTRLWRIVAFPFAYLLTGHANL